MFAEFNYIPSNLIEQPNYLYMSPVDYVSMHVFVCMLKCFHSCLYSRDLWFWHLKMWAIKTKPPPISSGSRVQNRGSHWRGDYTGEAEP